MNSTSLEALRRSLNSAENNLKQAKQLLNELEGSKPSHQEGRPANNHQSSPNSNNPVPDKPGVVGIYDGEKITTAGGEVFPVPGNYASKSLLVVGDTLKMYEEGGEKRFKQIEHVKRHKTNGLLVKKDGKFRAITPEGSYKVLTESINHFKGEVGDEVLLHLPAGNLTSPYGAIETIRKKKESGTPREPSEEVGVAEAKEVKVENPKEEPKKTPPKAHKVVKPQPKAAVVDAKKENPPPVAPPPPKPVAEPQPALEKQTEAVPEPAAPSEDELS